MKAIKAAFMHVIYVTFKNMSLKWFSKLSLSSLPPLTHPYQLVSSLIETLRPEVGQKRELRENTMREE